jgi:hypothetical protein
MCSLGLNFMESKNEIVIKQLVEIPSDEAVTSDYVWFPGNENKSFGGFVKRIGVNMPGLKALILPKATKVMFKETDDTPDMAPNLIESNKVRIPGNMTLVGNDKKLFFYKMNEESNSEEFLMTFSICDEEIKDDPNEEADIVNNVPVGSNLNTVSNMSTQGEEMQPSNNFSETPPSNLNGAPPNNFTEPPPTNNGGFGANELPSEPPVNSEFGGNGMNGQQPPGGNGMNGQPPGGNGINGAPPGGNGMNGQPPGGNGMNGQPPGGNGMNGQSPGGDGMNGQPPGGNGMICDHPRVD